MNILSILRWINQIDIKFVWNDCLNKICIFWRLNTITFVFALQNKHNDSTSWEEAATNLCEWRYQLRLLIPEFFITRYRICITRYQNFLFLLKKFKKFYHKMQCIVIIYISLLVLFVTMHFSLFHIQWSVLRCAFAAVKDKIMKSFPNITK